MNRAGIQKAIGEARLPDRVKKYLAVFANGKSASGLRRLLRAEPARLLEDMARVLERSAGTLWVPAEEVLFATGFHPGNLDAGRLEAALAELRAVNFLAGEGFAAIKLVPQTRSRTADLTAARGKNTYAFEVRCVTGGDSFAAMDFLFDRKGALKEAGKKALLLLEKKYRKKMPQAACSRKKNGLSHCGLVFVVNAGNFVPFAANEKLGELARALYEKVGRPPRTHLCLMAGGETGVFPGWDG